MLMKMSYNDCDTCWERAQCAHLRSLTASASFCSGFFFNFTNSSLVGIVPPSHPILYLGSASETRKKYHSQRGGRQDESLRPIDCNS